MEIVSKVLFLWNVHLRNFLSSQKIWKRKVFCVLDWKIDTQFRLFVLLWGAQDWIYDELDTISSESINSSTNSLFSVAVTMVSSQDCGSRFH